jgi:hypothetical protein
MVCPGGYQQALSDISREMYVGNPQEKAGGVFDDRQLQHQREKKFVVGCAISIRNRMNRKTGIQMRLL